MRLFLFKSMVSKETCDKLVQIARQQLMASTQHKQPRMDKIKIYEDAYNGRVQQKLRSTYNLPNLVFSGMIDTLEADFSDDISLRFEETDPADYNAVQRLNALWKQESVSLRSSSRWQIKTRWDKHMALFSGRGITKTYAESKPKYKSHFDVVDYRYFHCEPRGGGILENHLFVGEEGIYRTKEELQKGADAGIYSSDQIKKIIIKGADNEYKRQMEAAYGEKLSRFESLGLDADSNNYVGQEIYNLCEWGLTWEGTRFYLLFDPWSGEWVRCEENKDVFSSDLWQWTSWATHEDPLIFWTKSYADDLYPVGDAVKIAMDQEMTNRQKRNMGAKGYDKKMFPDVGKLDMAQYRPDSLVPMNVPENKSIKDGIFMFETPELQGTIDLINWIEQDLGKHSGVTELSGAQIKGKGANVQYTLLQQAQKRIGHKAKSYNECYQEVGLRFINGLIDHLSGAVAVKMIGKDGYAWDKVTRADLRLKKPFECKIINQTEEDKMNVLGKDQKIAALKMVQENQLLAQEVNPKVMTETILRDIGGMNDEMIRTLMDKQNYGQKDVLAEADKAISELEKGKMPRIVYDATTGFLARIMHFESVSRDELGMEKSKLFMDYIAKHIDIAAQNAAGLAAQIKMNQALSVPAQGQPNTAPQMNTQPQNPISRQQMAPMVSRPPMEVGGGVMAQ